MVGAFLRHCGKRLNFIYSPNTIVGLGRVLTTSTTVATDVLGRVTARTRTAKQATGTARRKAELAIDQPKGCT